MCELLRSFINKEIAIKNIRNEDELERLDELIKEQTNVVEKDQTGRISYSLKKVAKCAWYTFANRGVVIFDPKFCRYFYTIDNAYKVISLDSFLKEVEKYEALTTNPEEWMCMLNA